MGNDQGWDTVFEKPDLPPVIRTKLFRKSDFMLKKRSLCFENTKAAHFWPYLQYSEIWFCLNQLFVTSLVMIHFHRESNRNSQVVNALIAQY